MNNMNKRYGARGERGYNHGHPRAQGPNNNIYANPRNIIQLNTHNGYNSNTHYPPPTPPPLPPPHPAPSSNGISGRANGYPNSNYVVTHRVQQQYSVQTVNPTEHQNHQQPPINNITVGDLTFSRQQVSQVAPPLNNNAEEIQEDSLAIAVVPYINGANGSASNIPVSTATPPESSSAKPTPYEVYMQHRGFISVSKVEEYFIKLGEEMAKEKAENEVMKEAFEEFMIDNAKLKAQIKELQSHVSTVEQEKENQSRNFNELIAHEQKEATRARQDLFNWRNNAITLSEQLDSLKSLLSDKDKNIASLETQITEVKGENNGYMQRIRQLEQNEKGYVAEIHGKNNAIEQYKLDIRKKNDDLVKVDLRLKDKMKEMKQVDDEMNTLKKDLNMEILKEKKRVNELEGCVTEWKNKYTTAKEAAEGFKTVKKKMEGDKAKLENTVNEQNKCIEKKNEEIVQLTEDRDSIRTHRNSAVIMLQEQTEKTEALKTEVKELKEKNKKLSDDLQNEEKAKKQILKEHLDMYSRPTLLNQLVQQKMHIPPESFVATMISQPPRLSSPECSSPVVSEEVPEPLSAEQGCSDENLDHRQGDTHEVGRKRKHSTSRSGSNDVVPQKDPKTNGDSVSTNEQREERNEPGSSQTMKGQEEGEGTYRLRISTRRSSHGAVPSSANKNIPVQGNPERSNVSSSSVNGTGKSDKVRKTGKQEASIRIKIQNPNFNIKKSK